MTHDPTDTFQFRYTEFIITEIDSLGESITEGDTIFKDILNLLEKKCLPSGEKILEQFQEEFALDSRWYDRWFTYDHRRGQIPQPPGLSAQKLYFQYLVKYLKEERDKKLKQKVDVEKKKEKDKQTAEEKVVAVEMFQSKFPDLSVDLDQEIYAQRNLFNYSVVFALKRSGVINLGDLLLMTEAKLLESDRINRYDVSMIKLWLHEQFDGNVWLDMLNIPKPEIKLSIDIDSKISQSHPGDRMVSALKKVDIITWRQFLQKSEAELLRISRFGPKSLNKLKAYMLERGLEFGMDV